MTWIGIFPGQGSQQAGMGRFLFDNFKIAQQLFEEASDSISLDLKKLIFEGDESTLALTENTQPALVLTSTCYQRVLSEEFGFEFSSTAGHSVGEYSSLVLSQAMSFSTAIKSVRRRGEEMQKAVPPGQGGMTAVLGLEADQIQQLCHWASKNSGGGLVEPANLNSPGQIVISGCKKTLDWLNQNKPDSLFDPAPRRLKLIPLKVSAPFHSSMMKPAESAMAAYLENTEIIDSKIPVVQNYTATATTQSNELKNNLVHQISAPVRWIETIEGYVASGQTNFVELGWGKVLNGLCKKIAGKDVNVININSLEDLKEVTK